MDEVWGGGGGVITEAYTKCYKFLKSFDLNPIPPGLFEGGSAWKRRGGGGRKVPAAYNS